MGLGLPNIRPGDVVHVMSGSKAPLVLRPAGETLLSDKGFRRCYSLPRDCYVQGIMDGQIPDGYKRVEKKLKEGAEDVDVGDIQRFNIVTIFLN